MRRKKKKKTKKKLELRDAESCFALIHKLYNLIFCSTLSFSLFLFFSFLCRFFFKVHGCLHGYEVPTFLDDLDRQKVQHDSLVEHQRHRQCTRGTLLAGEEDEGLL